jgi:hypothetical protein
MEQAIFLNGKSYISAVQAAKKVGYASDYVGQLCRLKKISAKLIGKTWYVDLDELILHKKNRKLGKRKKGLKLDVSEGKKKFEKVEVNISAISEEKPKISQATQLPESAPVPYLQNIVITYEHDDRPRIPEISKPPLITSVPAKPKVVSPYHRKVAVGMLMVILFVSVSWVGVKKINHSQIGFFQNDSAVLSAKAGPASVRAVAAWFGNKFKKNSKESTLAVGGSTESSGIVVVPSGDDRQGTLSRLKRVFSDEVEVQFDQGGDSGLIIPVFRDGDDTEDYTFLLVPIREKREN